MPYNPARQKLQGGKSAAAAPVGPDSVCQGKQCHTFFTQKFDHGRTN